MKVNFFKRVWRQTHEKEDKIRISPNIFEASNELMEISINHHSDI